MDGDTHPWHDCSQGKKLRSCRMYWDTYQLVISRLSTQADEDEEVAQRNRNYLSRLREMLRKCGEQGHLVLAEQENGWDWRQGIRA